MKEDEYELVPENRFQKLEKKVEDIFNSPIIQKASAKEMSILMEDTNSSLMSLLDMLKKIQADTKFEEEEEKLIKKQIHPLVSEVKEIKEQNETLANSMLNIIDRLNDLQDELVAIKGDLHPFASRQVDSKLPPLEGGPTPSGVPTPQNPDALNQTIQPPNLSLNPVPQGPPPFGLKPKPVDVKPPKKKGLFGK